MVHKMMHCNIALVSYKIEFEEISHLDGFSCMEVRIILVGGFTATSLYGSGWRRFSVTGR